MPLDDAAEKAGQALDIFGMRVNNTEAQLVSLISYLVRLKEYKPYPSGFTHEDLVRDPSQRKGRLLLGTGAEHLNPENAIGVLLSIAFQRGMLNDPDVLKRISTGFGQASGNNGLFFKTDADLINWLTLNVRRLQMGPFVSALREVLGL